MARTWDVPAMLREMPAALFGAWARHYAEEPWDAPAQAVLAFGRRGKGSGPVDGDDAEGLEDAFARFAGGA